MSGKEENKGAEKKQAWGKLSSLNFVKLGNIELIEDEYTVGRAPTNTVVVDDIRLSGTHCKVFLHRENIKFLVQDLSSNGTFLNDSKIGKGNTVEIKNGDVIHILPKTKVKAEEVMGYVFCSTGILEDIQKRKREKEEAELAKLEAEKKNVATKVMEDLSEEMRCVICIDIIYKCATTIPCLHNFCSGCLSDWVQKSEECPSCREKVSEIKKNSTLNNMIELYLQRNADQRRSAEELKTLDERNKITKDKMTIKEMRPHQAQSVLGKGPLVATNNTNYQVGLFGNAYNYNTNPVRRNYNRGRRNYNNRYNRRRRRYEDDSPYGEDDYTDEDEEEEEEESEEEEDDSDDSDESD